MFLIFPCPAAAMIPGWSSVPSSPSSPALDISLLQTMLVHVMPGVIHPPHASSSFCPGTCHCHFQRLLHLTSSIHPQHVYRLHTSVTWLASLSMRCLPVPILIVLSLLSLFLFLWSASTSRFCCFQKPPLLSSYFCSIRQHRPHHCFVYFDFQFPRYSVVPYHSAAVFLLIPCCIHSCPVSSGPALSLSVTPRYLNFSTRLFYEPWRWKGHLLVKLCFVSNERKLWLKKAKRASRMEICKGKECTV